MSRLIRRKTTAVLSLVTATLCCAPLRAAETGEQWEYTGQMEMSGMKMPMPPSKVCSKAGAEVVPPVDKRCKISDVKTTASKTSYRVVCAPPDPMEGSGEAVRKGDTVQSVFRMKTRDGEMAMSMNGRKLGPCTPAGTN